MNITLRENLRQSQQQGLDRLDAQMLLLMALGRDVNDRAWLLAHDSDPMPADALGRCAELVRRRLAGEPVAYLSGTKAFYGIHLQVDTRVLVPRSDTETLVDWALETLQGCARPARLLDLGTGSGAIALAVKTQRPDVDVAATDASADALAVAQANARQLGLTVDFHIGHWLQAVPEQRFDVIASNPPYIAEGDPHLAALCHEPSSALTAGPDGLDDIRAIVAAGPEALQPGGWLLLEHGHDQAAAVRALLARRGFEQISSRNDLAGIARCSGGRWSQLR